MDLLLACALNAEVCHLRRIQLPPFQAGPAKSSDIIGGNLRLGEWSYMSNMEETPSIISMN